MASSSRVVSRLPLVARTGPSSLASRPDLEARPAASAVGLRAASTNTVNFSDAEALELLNKQRLQRPSSPWHIYLTSMTSLANRATGTGLSIVLYAFSLSYLTGAFDGAAFINMVASLPAWFTYTAKVAFSGGFWYHTINGVRATPASDVDARRSVTCRGIPDDTSYRAGYAVLGLTGIATVATSFLL